MRIYIATSGKDKLPVRMIGEVESNVIPNTGNAIIFRDKVYYVDYVSIDYDNNEVDLGVRDKAPK